MLRHYLLAAAIAFVFLGGSSGDSPAAVSCRSFCGNITVDYPLGLRRGCGHPVFRDLLFCVNGALMLLLPSGTYLALAIDYPYKALTLHDAAMSTCATAGTGVAAGFVVDPWRAPFLSPSPDTTFLLLGCRSRRRHLPCGDVAGMGCEGYRHCPAWHAATPCCAVSYATVGAVNLSQLECEGYSGAYSLAPLRPGPATGWSYGVRLSYSVPAEHEEACRRCEASGGACGHEPAPPWGRLCLCGAWNSTSSCDSGERNREMPAP